MTVVTEEAGGLAWFDVPTAWSEADPIARPLSILLYIHHAG